MFGFATRIRGSLRSLSVICLAFAACTATAATITVTTTADDATPNDGSVSLREAITAINSGNDLGDPDIIAQNPGTFGSSDQIHFNISGAGVHTITLTSALPILTKPVQILGYSQPLSSVNSLAIGDNAVILIRIDQNGQPFVFRLGPGSNSTAIEGFALVNTSSTAIDIQSGQSVIGGNFIGVDTDGVTQTGSGTAVGINPGVAGNSVGTVGNVAFRNVMASSSSDVVMTLGDNATIQGNYINTNAAGTAALGNSSNGITVGAGSATIGGGNPIDGNVIGQWNGNGINVGLQNINFPINSVTIIGNMIGVNAAGTAKLNPGLNGVALSDGNYAGVIGNGQAGAGNVISGAALTGIALAGGYTGLVDIFGNRIGTDVTGTAAIANGQSGICIGAGGGGLIGSGNPGQPNIIAFNGTNGVTIGGNAKGFSIEGNSIFSNGGLGISLAGRCDLANAPTPNDAGDADAGPNNLQNFPVLGPPTIAGGIATLSGTLNSTPFADFAINFYSNVACDPSGNGEGQTFIGSTSVSTDASGNASFTNIASNSIPAGQTFITATATDTNNPPSTSEFSHCAGTAAVLPPVLTKNFQSATIQAGALSQAGLAFTINNPNASGTLTGIAFTDILPAGLVINTPSGLTGSCSGVTATAGTNVITMSGGVVGAGLTCNILVTINAPAGTPPGLRHNVTSLVTSIEGGTGNPASSDITVQAVAATPPLFSKGFSPSSIALNGSTTLTFTITNTNLSSLTGIAFSDTLPAGLVVATPNGLTGSCGGGSIAAVGGAGIVSLSGATLAPGVQCAFSVNVTAITAGTKNNVTGSITATESGVGSTASASLTVAPAVVVVPPTIAKAFGGTSIALNTTTTLTFTLTNPNAATALTGVGFTDTLPAGLVVTNPNGLASTCGGTVTAVAGSGSISLASATLAGSASCNFGVNVTGTTVGTKINTTGAITSVEGGTGGIALANLVVTGGAPPLPPSPTTPIPTLQDWALWLLGLLILVTASVSFRQRRRD